MLKYGEVFLECPALAGPKLYKREKALTGSPKGEHSNLNSFE